MNDKTNTLPFRIPGWVLAPLLAIAAACLGWAHYQLDTHGDRLCTNEAQLKSMREAMQEIRRNQREQVKLLHQIKGKLNE